MVCRRRWRSKRHDARSLPIIALSANAFDDDRRTAVREAAEVVVEDSAGGVAAVDFVDNDRVSSAPFLEPQYSGR